MGTRVLRPLPSRGSRDSPQALPPGAVAFQSHWPGSASRRHPQRPDSRTDEHRDSRPHRRFQPPDSRRACAHAQDPGAGLGSDTCNQQVSGPRPLSRQDAPPPSTGPASSSRPAPAREFPAFPRVMLPFREVLRGARSRESRTRALPTRGWRAGREVRKDVADLWWCCVLGTATGFHSRRARPAVLRLGLRLCSLSAAAPGAEPRFCGFSHCWVRTAAVLLGTRYGLFAIEWLVSFGVNVFSLTGSFVTTNKMNVLITVLTQLIFVRKFGSILSAFWSRF